MREQLEHVLKELKKQSDIKNLKKINKELQEIMRQIKEALLLNPDFVPQGKAITRLKKEGQKKMAAASAVIKPDNLEEKELNDLSVGEENKKEKIKKEKQPEVKLDVKPLAIKKIRLKKLGISCGIVSLGEDGPEVLSQGNLIYINQDHPLYQKFYKKGELLSLHLLRLVSQEIVLMKKLRITASEAFVWQGKLLKDALCK